MSASDILATFLSALAVKLISAAVRIGTKSVLFGAHCFFLHPFFVAEAWRRLYGFPRDPRLWAAFFLHDIGYIGKANMDGREGESHPETGARIMGWLFDGLKRGPLGNGDRGTYWHDFCLFHSRHYAKAAGKPYSKLCVADKLAFAIDPKWLYLLRVRLTGEISEYLENARFGRGEVSNANPGIWHDTLKAHMVRWVEAHKHEEVDTWTVVRHDHTTERYAN